MASQFAPDFLPIIDPKSIPLFYVGGLYHYEVMAGLALLQMFGVGPICSLADFGNFPPQEVSPCLQVVMQLDVQVGMRQQIHERALACAPRH